MNNLEENIKKVFESTDIKNLIESKVNELSDKKSSKVIKKYMKAIDEETSNYIDEKLRKIVKKVSRILEHVVNDFVSEHANDFNICENRIKSEAILEALGTVCKIAGVNAQLITQEANNVSKKSEKILESKIEVLKTQLQEQININRKNENIIQRLNDKIDTDADKDKEIEDLKESISKLNAENIAITKEKNDVIRLGIISEMKENMSLVEADKFEKNAKNIPFSLDKKYLKKLETLKQSIISEHEDEDKDENENDSKLTEDMPNVEENSCYKYV